MARLYRHLAIDQFRFDLLEIRYHLFNLAAAGGIAPEHPAFGRLQNGPRDSNGGLTD